MIGRQPREIWQGSLEDGQRRLARPTSVLAATGLLGGFHVTLGLLGRTPLGMNHSVVGFGEILFGIAAGTTDAGGSTLCATPRSRWWATSPAA